MLKKICSFCGKSYQVGDKCSCNRSRQKDYDRYDRNKESASFYHSISWKAMTQRIRQLAYGLDELLWREKKLLRAGKITHHIYTVEERPDLALREENLIYVNVQTHNMIHAVYEKSAEKKRQMQARLLKIVASRS